MSQQIERQKLYDTIVGGVLKQGRASIAQKMSFDGTPYFACQYRSPCGDKCAVGQVISDSAYSERFEGFRVGNTEVQNALKQSDMGTPDNELLTALQSAHDTSGVLSHNNSVPTPEQFIRAFRVKAARVAGQYGLNIEVLA